MIYPISFCIPECKIIKEICLKERVVATIIPGNLETYIYKFEKDYYEGYAKSVFGITKCKAGWDCMRHYEILANGCIPWFENLKDCPPQRMTHFPKEIILECMKSGNIRTAEEMYGISQKLLEYTRKHLTTKAMASYVLRTSNNTHAKSVLYLSNDTFPDYLRELLLHGFKELFGSECHDFPRIDFLYKDYPENKIDKMYGKGITYTRLLDPEQHNYSKNTTLIQDIKNHVYDCIVYGSVHRGTPYLDEVNKAYKENEIIFLCGEDIHDCMYKYNCGNHTKYSLFIREL